MQRLTYIFKLGKLAIGLVFIVLTIRYGARYAMVWTHRTALPEVAVTAEAAVARSQSATTLPHLNVSHMENVSDDSPRPYGPPALIFQSHDITYRAIHQISSWDPTLQSWTAVSPDLTDVNVEGAPGYGIDGITAVATHDNTWYVGTLVGRIVTKHSGTAWVPSKPGTVPDRTVSALAMDTDFQDGSVAAAGFAGYSSTTPDAPGHVYLTMDGGLTWVDISGSLPDEPIQNLLFSNQHGHQSLFVELIGNWWRLEENGTWISIGTLTP